MNQARAEYQKVIHNGEVSYLHISGESEVEKFKD